MGLADAAKSYSVLDCLINVESITKVKNSQSPERLNLDGLLLELNKGIVCSRDKKNNRVDVALLYHSSHMNKADRIIVKCFMTNKMHEAAQNSSGCSFELSRG